MNVVNLPPSSNQGTASLSTPYARLVSETRNSVQLMLLFKTSTREYLQRLPPKEVLIYFFMSPPAYILASSWISYVNPMTLSPQYLYQKRYIVYDVHGTGMCTLWLQLSKLHSSSLQ